MSEKDEKSLQSHVESEKSKENVILSEQKENDCTKENNDNYYDIINSDIRSSVMNNVIKDEEISEDTEKESENIFLSNTVEKTDLLQLIDDLDDRAIRDNLSNLSEQELLEKLNELESTNFYLSKENEVFEFILNDEDMFESILKKAEEMDKDVAVPELFELTYPAKCYFAKKKLEHAEKVLKLKNDNHALELQNLKFELESLNRSLKDLNEAKEKFDEDIRIDGRHPVTKKVMLQKVAKYFDDSIRMKMDLANRYKIQIQDDIREQNKIISQIKAQEKRLAFLDTTEFQQAHFEYKKSCRELAMCKKKLGKYKAQQSLLLQKIAKLKKDLKEEENQVEQMKINVKKFQHLKEVMLSGKTKDDERASELAAAMQKIKFDPLRHDLPEVIDYAAAQRENRILMKKVDEWRKRVDAIQKEKLLQLNDSMKTY